MTFAPRGTGQSAKAALVDNHGRTDNKTRDENNKKNFKFYQAACDVTRWRDEMGGGGWVRWLCSVKHDIPIYKACKKLLSTNMC